ncbi:hypothetical protein Tco_1475925 [Tanacetum coccineum]
MIHLRTHMIVCQKILVKIMSSHDPQCQFPKQTQEEEPKSVSMKTEEENLLPIDVRRGTNTKGEARYGVRSLGPIQEEVVVVKKPYSLVKVINAVLELKSPKAKVMCDF